MKFPGVAPSNKNSRTFAWGKTKTGGIAVSEAFIKQQYLPFLYLSAKVNCPTCLYPFCAMTFSAL